MILQNPANINTFNNIIDDIFIAYSSSPTTTQQKYKKILLLMLKTLIDSPKTDSIRKRELQQTQSAISDIVENAQSQQEMQTSPQTQEQNTTI